MGLIASKLFISLPRRILPYYPLLVDKAKELRNNSTYSEVQLWKRLRNFQMMGYDFDRQKPILSYIVDFFCVDLMLAIEVDGITHRDEADYARQRQVEIEQLGVHFLRFDAIWLIKHLKEATDQIAVWIEDFKTRHDVPERVLRQRRKSK